MRNAQSIGGGDKPSEFRGLLRFVLLLLRHSPAHSQTGPLRSMAALTRIKVRVEDPEQSKISFSQASLANWFSQTNFLHVAL